MGAFVIAPGKSALGDQCNNTMLAYLAFLISHLTQENWMSKMMILGVKGEAGLWLVDFDAGTVTAMDGNREDFISGHDSDDKFETDIDVAIGFEPKEAAFSGRFFEASNTADIAVAFEPKQAAFSGRFFQASESVDVAVAFETKDTAFSGRSRAE